MKSTIQTILIVSFFLLQPSIIFSQSFCQKVIADNGDSNDEYFTYIYKTTSQELEFLLQYVSISDSNMKTMVGRITSDGDSIWLKRYDLVNPSIATREQAQSIVEAPNHDLVFALFSLLTQEMDFPLNKVPAIHLTKVLVWQNIQLLLK